MLLPSIFCKGNLSEVLETIQIRKAEQMRYMQMMRWPMGRPSTDCGVGRAKCSFATLWLTCCFFTSLNFNHLSGFSTAVQRPLQHLLGYCRASFYVLTYLSWTWPQVHFNHTPFQHNLGSIIKTRPHIRDKKKPNPRNYVQAEAHLLSTSASPLIFHSQRKIVHDMIRKEKNAMWPNVT